MKLKNKVNKIRQAFQSLFHRSYLNLGYVCELKKRGIGVY